MFRLEMSSSNSFSTSSAHSKALDSKVKNGEKVLVQGETRDSKVKSNTCLILTPIVLKRQIKRIKERKLSDLAESYVNQSKAFHRRCNAMIEDFDKIDLNFKKLNRDDYANSKKRKRKELYNRVKKIENMQKKLRKKVNKLNGYVNEVSVSDRDSLTPSMASLQRRNPGVPYHVLNKDRSDPEKPFRTLRLEEMEEVSTINEAQSFSIFQRNHFALAEDPDAWTSSTLNGAIQDGQPEHIIEQLRNPDFAAWFDWAQRNINWFSVKWYDLTCHPYFMRSPSPKAHPGERNNVVSLMYCNAKALFKKDNDIDTNEFWLDALEKVFGCITILHTAKSTRDVCQQLVGLILVATRTSLTKWIYEHIVSLVESWDSLWLEEEAQKEEIPEPDEEYVNQSGVLGASKEVLRNIRYYTTAIGETRLYSVIKDLLMLIVSSKLIPESFLVEEGWFSWFCDQFSYIHSDAKMKTLDLMNAFISVCEFVVEAADAYQSGVTFSRFLFPSSISARYADIKSRRQSFLTGDMERLHSQTNIDYVRDVTNLADEIHSQLNAKRVPSTLIGTYHVYRTSLLTLKNELNALMSHHGLRIQPFAFVLCSDPGFGKSSIMEAFIQAFGQVSGVNVEPQYRYALPERAKYQSGLTHEHKVISCDDIGNTKIGPGDIGESSLTEMVHIINNNPYMSNQADCEAKGKIYYETMLVAATTNTLNMKADEVSAEPASIDRRFCSVEIRVIPEYQKVPNGPTPSHRQVDPSKVPLIKTPHGMIRAPAHEVRFYHIHYGQTNMTSTNALYGKKSSKLGWSQVVHYTDKYPDGWMSIQEGTTTIANLMKTHLEDQRTFLDNLENSKMVPRCPKCFNYKMEGWCKCIPDFVEDRQDPDFIKNLCSNKPLSETRAILEGREEYGYMKQFKAMLGLEKAGTSETQKLRNCDEAISKLEEEVVRLEEVTFKEWHDSKLRIKNQAKLREKTMELAAMAEKPKEDTYKDEAFTRVSEIIDMNWIWFHAKWCEWGLVNLNSDLTYAVFLYTMAPISFLQSNVESEKVKTAALIVMLALFSLLLSVTANVFGFLLSVLLFIAMFVFWLYCMASVMVNSVENFYERQMDRLVNTAVTGVFRTDCFKWAVTGSVMLSGLYVVRKIYEGVNRMQNEGNITPRGLPDMEERDQEPDMWEVVQTMSLQPVHEISTMTILQRYEAIRQRIGRVTTPMDERLEVSSNFWNLSGNVIIINKHFFDTILEYNGDYKEIQFQLTFWSGCNKTITTHFKSYKQVPGKDFCLVRLANYLPLSATVKWFPETVEKISTTAMMISFDDRIGVENVETRRTCDLFEFGKNFHVDSHLYRSVMWKTDTAVKNASFTEQLGSKHMVSLRTTYGDCMAPVVDFRTGLILGFHCGSHASKPEAVAFTLLRSDIEKLLEDEYVNDGFLYERVSYDSLVDTVKTTGPDGVEKLMLDPEIHYRSVANFIRPNAVTYVAVFGSATQYRIKPKSDVRTHIYSKCLEKHGLPNKFGPPAFKSDRNHAEYFQVAINGSKSMPDPEVRLSCHEYLGEIVDFISQLKSRDGMADVHPLTMFETLNGIKGRKFFKKLNLDTAAGFGLKGKKKQYFVEHLNEKGEPVFTLTPMLELEVSRIYECYDRGIMVCPFVKTALKDEPVLRPEYNDGKEKVRVFAVYPVAHFLVGKQLFLPILAFLYAIPVLSECFQGINSITEWDQVAQILLRNRDRILEADFKKMDVRLSGQSMRATGLILTSLAKHLGYTNDEIKRLSMYIEDLAYTYFIFGGTVFALDKYNTSGNFLTVVMNGLDTSRELRTAFRQLKLPRQLGTFRDHVNLGTVGDDLIGCTDVPEFNLRYLQEFYAKRNRILTSAKKSDEMEDFLSLDEATLCKRTFRFEERVNQYVAPLDIDSILRSIHMYRLSSTTAPSTVFIQNMTSACRSLAFHSKEIFEYYHERLSIALEELQMKHLIDKFEYSYEDWWNLFKKDYYGIKPEEDPFSFTLYDEQWINETGKRKRLCFTQCRGGPAGVKLKKPHL